MSQNGDQRSEIEREVRLCFEPRYLRADEPAPRSTEDRLVDLVLEHRAREVEDAAGSEINWHLERARELRAMKGPHAKA